MFESTDWYQVGYEDGLEGHQDNRPYTMSDDIPLHVDFTDFREAEEEYDRGNEDGLAEREANEDGED